MYIPTTGIAAVATTTSSWLGIGILAAGAEASMTIADGEGSKLQRWSSLIGIITAIIGNILISFALNIQRYAHIQLHKEQQQEKRRSRLSLRSLRDGYGTTDANNKGTIRRKNPSQSGREELEPLTDHGLTNSDQLDSTDVDNIQEKSYLKSPYWWAGILLMTVGETGNFLAYGFAPASIVSPLGVVALISNCVIAPIMLKERFRWRDFAGVVIAVGGAVTVVLSARQEEKKLGPHEVIGAITTTAFEIYMGVTFAMIVVLLWASPRYGSRTILIDLGLVGLFGGYTALSTKGVASMLSSTLWKAFTTPITYALIAVLASTAIMQVKYVNKALQRFDSTQVIPVQFVMFTLSVIIGSAILYRDFEQANVERISKFVGGCLLTFFGVFLITSGRASADDDSDDESYEDEDQQTSSTVQEPGDSHYYDSGTMVQRRQAEDESDDNDSTPTPSRRSSHISFGSASTERRPQTPRVHSSTSQTPSIRLTAAEESSPLLKNLWKESHDDSLGSARAHPGLPSTASSPFLPSQTRFSSTDPPSPSGTLSRTTSQSNPHTHPNHQRGGPPQADVAQRPMTPRHSLSRSMLPGLYISPLSSSLSAVVADTQRRGMERKNSQRRARLTLSRTKSGTQQASDSEDYMAGGSSSPTKASGPASFSKTFGLWMGSGNEEREDVVAERPGKGRSRSLSNTLGSFLRAKMGRRGSAGDDIHGDYDEGSAGHI